MIENKYVELSKVDIRKVIPSSVKRNGKPVSAQLCFQLDEQIGSGANKAIVKHSQSCHVHLEDDGEYHYRNMKIVMVEGKHGQLEAKSVPVHFEFLAGLIIGVIEVEKSKQEIAA